MLAEGNADGSYRTVRDGYGLADFADLTDSPGRSNILINSGFMYCVAGTTLFRVDQFATVTALGTVGGSGRAVILENSVPGDNQIMVLNGVGLGYVYTNAGGLVQVSDSSFFATVSGSVLGERGWFARRGTNEFFGSDISNFGSYDPLTFATAEQSPGNVVAVVQKKTALWVLGADDVEYWQTTNNTTLPLRPVIGASKERGISAAASLAEAGERFCWFADDNTIRMIEGSQMSKISDLDFELRVRGDGDANFPGFAVTDDAVGFFIDGPVHKIYYLTFPTEKFTWGYDFSTGLTHQRASGNTGDEFWRVGASALFNNKLYGLDITAGKIYELTTAAKSEAGEIMMRQITTPSISSPYDWTLPYLELDMEVGQITDPTVDPQMIVQYSKDGGYSYINKGTVSLGKYGNQRARVPMRQFGRIVRHKDFILRLTFTDDVKVQLYTLWADIEQDG